MKKIDKLVANESGKFDTYVTTTEFPTPNMSDASMAWHDAALEESKRLLSCARSKRNEETFDQEGSEKAFIFARELLELGNVLKACPGIDTEVAAEIRRMCIDRIIRISELTRDFCGPR